MKLAKAPPSAAFLALALTAGCSHSALHSDGREPRCVSERRIPSMGTFFEIQLATACGTAFPDTLYLEIRTTLDQMEAEMSLYQPQSPISRLNRDGELPAPGPHLSRVLSAAIESGEKTNGAFDVTIQPVLARISDSFSKNGLAPTDLDRFRSRVDYRLIAMSKDRVRFKQAGTQISLDGIAKGYAVDEIVDRLFALGYRDFLVNFSGNMRWQGRNAQGDFWKIAVWNPVQNTAESLPPTESGAIASSGADQNHFSKDLSWHHIIDPKTLRPPRRYAATTAIGPRAMICDVLSTAFFVAEEREIQEMIRKNYPEYSYRVRKVNGADI